MNKVEKFEQTKSIERYLNERRVREMFKDLMKQLLVKRPEDPIDFLIKQLEGTACKFQTYLVCLSNMFKF